MPVAKTTPTVQFKITVDQFRNIGSLMTCSITMEPVGAIPSAVTREGTYSMAIKKPEASETDHMLIKFILEQKDYLLLGIAFSAKNFSQAAASVKCGQDDFASVTLATTEVGSVPYRQMTIQNNRKNRGRGPGKYGSFDYMIIIQQVTTGEIGVIDPEIINEE